MGGYGVCGKLWRMEWNGFQGQGRLRRAGDQTDDLVVLEIGF